MMHSLDIVPFGLRSRELPSSRKGGMNEVAAWRLEGEVNLAIGTLRGVHVRSTQVNLINQMSFVKLQVKSPFLGCTP